MPHSPQDPDAAHLRPAPGSGGVYGRRTGRKLHSLQSRLMADVLPRWSIDIDQPFDQTVLFPDATDLWLEIGFGGGEHLVHHAKRRPDLGLIGCEPFRNGIAKFLEEATAATVGNVRIFTGDAALLANWLLPGSVAGVDLFYPDPWPRRRQRKRRFVSDETLRRLARVMRPGAPLRFATDIDDYAGWTLARMERSAQFRWTAKDATDWLRPWDGWPSTRYEAKALKEGRPPVYLTFERTEAPGDAQAA